MGIEEGRRIVAASQVLGWLDCKIENLIASQQDSIHNLSLAQLE
jgi:hypothetical protein